MDSPEAMEVSVCEANMTIDTPSALPVSLPKEDLLRRQELDFWDVPGYASDIYNYLRQAEVSFGGPDARLGGSA